MVPPARVHDLNARPVRPDGRFCLYWMTAARRLRSNFALDRAAGLAIELGRPLVILEALRCDYPGASDRFHRFVLDGMRAHAAELERTPVLYYPYVEPEAGHGRGLVAALASEACAVITDWHPSFIFPGLMAAAARQAGVRAEAVDSNGIIPVAAHERGFPTARGYRAFLQRVLREHVRNVPDAAPLARLEGTPRLAALPDAVSARWPAASKALLDGRAPALAALPIDHRVAPAEVEGGGPAARRTLKVFLDERLARYAEDHQHPDREGTSRLSPYLHFGHISAHEIFDGVATAERWTTRRLSSGGGGGRTGWWGLSPSAEMFLDQLLVWRELAFNGAARVAGFGSYEALPAWARSTLEQHLEDERSHVYGPATLEAAATHDRVWNAAQRQLATEGWCHGYLRMLWGKNILAWSRHPADALAIMDDLMTRYALDGRDPVSSAGIAWVLGHYDRPWPERPVFGTVRCMTSASAVRKLEMREYLRKYGDAGPQPALFG